jgi:hypothetical protein
MNGPKSWGQVNSLGLRCGVASGENSFDVNRMIFVIASIYVGAILLCVGTTAWLLRAWTRRRYWHRSPSDLHYIVTGAALLLSAGIGVLVVSQIVLALGQ